MCACLCNIETIESQQNHECKHHTRLYNGVVRSARALDGTGTLHQCTCGEWRAGHTKRVFGRVRTHHFDQTRTGHRVGVVNPKRLQHKRRERGHRSERLRAGRVAVELRVQHAAVARRDEDGVGKAYHGVALDQAGRATHRRPFGEGRIENDIKIAQWMIVQHHHTGLRGIDLQLLHGLKHVEKISV